MTDHHPDAMDTLVIPEDEPEAPAARCPHPEVVPIDDDWGRCTTCGDSTFPLSAFAAGDTKGEPEPKAKRKKSTSPTARTLAECRKRGWIAQVVERHLPFPRPHGTKQDLFGVIDIVAIAPAFVGQHPLSDHAGDGPCVACSRPSAVVGIQATANSGGLHARRRAKILAEPRMRAWLDAGARLELWTWALQGARGKAKRWTLRVEVFMREIWGPADAG